MVGNCFSILSPIGSFHLVLWPNLQIKENGQGYKNFSPSGVLIPDKIRFAVLRLNLNVFNSTNSNKITIKVILSEGSKKVQRI